MAQTASKLRGASPELIAQISAQLTTNPILTRLVARGVMKWEDLLKQGPDGASVIDTEKIAGLQVALQKHGQLASQQAMGALSRYTVHQTTAGDKPTAAAGLSVYMGPRWPVGGR